MFEDVVGDESGMEIEAQKDTARELHRRGDSTYRSLSRDVEDSDDEDSSVDGDDTDEEITYEPDNFHEGVFGMAVVSLIVDTRKIETAKTARVRMRHVCRMLIVFFFLLLSLGMQAYIIIMTKVLVTPDAVMGMRELYSEYEQVMYDNHTYLTRFGHHRGISPAYFNMSKYPEFKKNADENICAMPLSQGFFLFAIVLLWTLTCFRYIRLNLNVSARILCLPWKSSLKHVVDHKGKQKVGVGGLTLCVKSAILLFVQIPALLVQLFLLWLGARWLVATMGFDELVLNAIALEFILVLHELIYHVVVPHSLKADVDKTRLPHFYPKENRGCLNMFGTFAVFTFAVLFAALYVRFFQQVLPDYKFDVNAACALHAPRMSFI